MSLAVTGMSDEKSRQIQELQAQLRQSTQTVQDLAGENAVLKKALREERCMADHYPTRKCSFCGWTGGD